jgi:Secretion system C-terminal sorting domain
MKSKLLILLPLLSAFTLSAQLAITTGTQFSLTGNTQLTLQNTDLVNNGNFTTGSSMTSFTGNAASSVSGSQPVQFFEMEMNKTNNTSVSLQRPIAVSKRILFTAGFLNLNGFNTDLGSTAFLDGEQENSRVTGTGGGQLLFTTTLNAPVGANPANLGAVISSGQNLGNVTIKRGQRSQAGFGTGSSILRFYDIVPANDVNLNATLRINYFDGELNGLDENSLVVFKSDDTVRWSGLGFSSRSTASNFVEKTGISSFSRWTLSSANNALPVRFILFNANCEGNKVLLTWKTAQEQNSSHFNIESSADGISWAVTGNLPAAGNSSNESSYSFTDNNPVQNGFYRIAEYDLNGNAQYSSILRSSCSTADGFRLWPNPVHEQVYINIVTGNQSQAIIKVLDSKGALVKMQRSSLLQGSNQLSVDMKTLANGIYEVAVGWNDGQMNKTVRVLKE